MKMNTLMIDFICVTSLRGHGEIGESQKRTVVHDFDENVSNLLLTVSCQYNWYSHPQFPILASICTTHATGFHGNDDKVLHRDISCLKTGTVHDRFSSATWTKERTWCKVGQRWTGIARINTEYSRESDCVGATRRVTRRIWMSCWRRGVGTTDARNSCVRSWRATSTTCILLWLMRVRSTC